MGITSVTIARIGMSEIRASGPYRCLRNISIHLIMDSSLVVRQSHPCLAGLYVLMGQNWHFHGAAQIVPSLPHDLSLALDLSVLVAFKQFLPWISGALLNQPYHHVQIEDEMNRRTVR